MKFNDPWFLMPLPLLAGYRLLVLHRERRCPALAFSGGGLKPLPDGYEELKSARQRLRERFQLPLAMTLFFLAVEPQTCKWGSE